MLTGTKFLCCCEVDHTGFQAMCLDVWALPTTYLTYRSRYGEAEEETSWVSTQYHCGYTKQEFMH